jgi:signal transduction histidine kinase
VPVRDSLYAGWLMGSIRSGLVAIDETGVLAALNDSAHRLLGCPGAGADAVIGQDCRAVLAGQPVLLDRLLATLDGNEAPGRAELSLVGRGARPGPTIGYTAATVRDETGAVRGAVLQFRDLTPYERTAEQDRLRDRLAALGEMAAGLAHEIRNPLAGMEILTGLLRRRLGDQPEALALVQELSAEIRRAAQTVTESLEFVRPVALRCDLVDPIELLEESLALARSRVPFDGDVERDYAELLPALHADGERLECVLTNLLVNAMEAMEEAKSEPRWLRLGVRVERAEDLDAGAEREPELVFSVADAGPGIPDELRERVFYPFFTTKEAGTGVGLAQAQKIIAGHGGRLELSGDGDGGALFRVRLPLAPDESGSSGNAAHEKGTR